MKTGQKIPAYSQCSGKEPFTTPQLAVRVLKRWTKAKRRQGKRMDRSTQTYRCAHCGFFHIGGMTKR